ncbi:MAG: cytochrome P450 [Acidimicrobiales bacterium]|nr:cytochrome P450 [Acidimicrobiales bacterium]
MTITERDPFDEFNRVMGAGTGVDPYPALAELRREAPIHGPASAPGAAPAAGLFTAYSFDAVSQVLRDDATFSSSLYSQVMGPVMGRSILEMDEPEHHAYRVLLQQAFTRKEMQRWETELVAPVVHRLIDGFVADGEVDLVRSFHFPFPMTVIAGMMGLPDTLLREFHRLGVELISVSVDMPRATAAAAELGELFGEQLADRRRRIASGTPGDDLISVLAQAEHDGQRLTDDEIFAFLRLLLPAGAETTYRSSGNLMAGLLRNPDQLDALRADRSLLPQAIEEALRWECPLLQIQRMAVRDGEVCGVGVGAGSVIMVMLGAANRDEARWDDPDRFDIFRPARPHVAFASGVHACLGMHLARMETTVAIGALLDRLDGLRLADDEAGAIEGAIFRAPAHLRVVWDA